MKVFYFISRSKPTADQIKLAKKAKITLSYYGEIKAFSRKLGEILYVFRTIDHIDGIICNNPVVAVRAIQNNLTVGVFEDKSSAGNSKKPISKCGKLILMYPPTAVIYESIYRRPCLSQPYPEEYNLDDQ